MNKLGIGTAQFGLDYGISNSDGEVSNDEIWKILDYSRLHGIKLIDTATVYGRSEEKIGNYLISHKEINFDVVSKFKPSNDLNIQLTITNSIHKLNIECLYGMLIHDFNSFIENRNTVDELIEAKHKKTINKFGFSLYYPKDLEFLLGNNIPFDIIQIPYNIFDQRFKEYFRELSNKKIEIHIRSVFLQGLFFLEPEYLNPFFESIKNKLERLNEYSKEQKYSIADMCLDFVKDVHVSKIIVGLNSLKHLEELISSYNKSTQIKLYANEFRHEDEKIIIPNNWKLNTN